MYWCRLVSEVEELAGCSHSAAGAYGSVCVQLDTDALAVCALLQAHSVLQLEGTCPAAAFGAAHASIQDAMANAGTEKTIQFKTKQKYFIPYKFKNLSKNNRT